MSVRAWSRRRRLGALALSVYLALLAASHAVRALNPAEPPALGPDQRAVQLAAVRADGTAGREVRVVYEDRGPKGAPVVVLLHGSPGSLASVRRLSPWLEPSFRTLAVDLPGFGKSELDVPDYGFDAHAGYVLELLDRLEIESAHLLGFSMGGGVALEAARQAPERVRSVVLLAAIGVQELELLGSYHLNHAVHGLQVGLFWAATYLTPHFGLLDGAFFGLPYARNFYDSDQRPLREVLEGYAGPMLVIHSPQDPLVPIEAAREHARLVPQAERVELEVEGDRPGSEAPGIAGHLLPIRDAERVGPLVADFVERVERGEAPTRADAAPARVEAAQEPFEAIPLEAMGLWIAALLIAAATLVSEDLTCIATGALVAQGRIDFAVGALACFVGIYVGDLLLFLTGRLAGARALKVPPLSWMLDDRAVERAAHWFEQRGLWAIFLTRFMPGTRLPTYFAAGALRTSALLFALYFAIAAGVWTPILVWLSSLIGGNLRENVEAFEDALPLMLLATVAIGLVVVKGIVPAATWRGRRALVGSWTRKVHWEFWPPWLFYPPVVLRILWRGLRAGRLTAFTASNPGIRYGGFIGESKREILERLAGAAEALPAWAAIPAGADPERRRAALRAFLDGPEAPGFPLVLKPDVGQRGSGVVVARDAERAVEYVSETDIGLIAQAWVPGQEFGVFYARFPSEDVGRVLSVTVKRPATVTGDGHRSLEELILADRRAVALAEVYLRRNADDLDRVPAAGETVEISNLGTHALGAVFTDGADLIGPELEAAVDRIARCFDGFYFGRFDLRCPDAQALREGRDLRVIELNGVTSEMTHVYDRRHSVWYGWRTLFRQWDTAFAIAAENRARGVRTPSTFALLREVWRYRRGARQHAE